MLLTCFTVQNIKPSKTELNRKPNDKPHPSQSNSFPCVFPWVYYFYFNSSLDFYSLLKIIVMTFSKTLFGGLRIEKNGFFMNYFGYTKKEAIAKFRQDYKKNLTQ